MWHQRRFTAVVLVTIMCAASVRMAGQLSWGKFSGPIQVELQHTKPNDRTMKLLVDVTYVDPSGKQWTAPKGFVSDGASIPRAFWTVVGTPWGGAYREAAIIHDRYCETKTEPWQDVHRIFYYASRAVGVPEGKAKLLYTAVRYGGPRWGDDNSKCSLVCHADKGAAHKTTPLIRRRTTHVDVNWLVEWVERNNPTLDQIDELITRESDRVAPLPRK